MPLDAALPFWLDNYNLGGGRFATDRDGYAAILGYGRQWTERVWAVEGCAGIGKHIATRLLARAAVADVPGVGLRFTRRCDYSILAAATPARPLIVDRRGTSSRSTIPVPRLSLTA